MRRSDFHTGLIFHNVIGTWQCTDVGARTITAVLLVGPDVDVPNEPRWREGPPYALKEKVFNEQDITRAYLDLAGALGGAMRHPHRFYPMEFVSENLHRRHANPAGVMDFTAYPMARLVGIRVGPNHHELSAHDASKDDAGQWCITVFDFHTQTTLILPEAAWFALPFAADQPHEPRLSDFPVPTDVPVVSPQFD